MTMQMILIVLGSFGVGWIVPEFLAAISGRNVPIPMNIWCGGAFAMLAAGMVLK